MRAQSNTLIDFEVFEENWEIVEMFMRAQTQWIIGPMGGFIGMNYQSLGLLFNIYNVNETRELFEGIQLMEIEILTIKSQERKNGN